MTKPAPKASCEIVHSVINDLGPHLAPGDLIIDAGNSVFKDTDVPARTLKAKSLL